MLTVNLVSIAELCACWGRCREFSLWFQLSRKKVTKQYFLLYRFVKLGLQFQIAYKHKNTYSEELVNQPIFLTLYIVTTGAQLIFFP